jgi:hypothetical protein
MPTTVGASVSLINVLVTLNLTLQFQYPVPAESSKRARSATGMSTIFFLYRMSPTEHCRFIQ